MSRLESKNAHPGITLIPILSHKGRGCRSPKRNDTQSLEVRELFNHPRSWALDVLPHHRRRYPAVSSTVSTGATTRQGSFPFRHRGRWLLLAHPSSGSAFTRDAGAHGLLPPFKKRVVRPCLAAALRPSSPLDWLLAVEDAGPKRTMTPSSRDRSQGCFLTTGPPRPRVTAPALGVGSEFCHQLPSIPPHGGHPCLG